MLLQHSMCLWAWASSGDLTNLVPILLSLLPVVFFLCPYCAWAMPPPILHGNSQPILPFIQSLHHCQHIPLQRQAMDSLLSYSDKVSGSHINSCPSCFGSCLSTLNLAFVLSPGLLWCSTHSPTTPDERMSLLQDTATRLLKVLPLVSAYDW